jgi:hypothetical protein
MFSGAHEPPNTALKRCGTASTAQEDLARVEIFVFFNQLADLGQVALTPLPCGDVEARFVSGETFLLGDSGISRVS